MSEQTSIGGTVQKLTVGSKTSFGFYLLRGDEEIPINDSEIHEEINEGDTREFFVYPDRRGRLTASTIIPEIRKGVYGWARVIKVNDRDGAALDIGISREVTVVPEDLPAVEHVWPEAGDYLYITLRTDLAGQMFGRLATEEVVQVLSERADDDVHNKELKGRPYRLLRVGTFVLTEEGYRCFIHESERKSEPRLGQDVTVRIIGVKDDGTLNGSLLPRKQDKMDEDSEVIFNYLLSRGGSMPFGDKSNPEEIKMIFNMSKASFKRALGRLYKEKKIVQENGETHLVQLGGDSNEN